MQEGPSTHLEFGIPRVPRCLDKPSSVQRCLSLTSLSQTSPIMPAAFVPAPSHSLATRGMTISHSLTKSTLYAVPVVYFFRLSLALLRAFRCWLITSLAVAPLGRAITQWMNGMCDKHVGSSVFLRSDQGLNGKVCPHSVM